MKEKIKDDTRVIYANELMRHIENIVYDDMIKEYHLDASLYLLMKASHLIANLTSKEYGYKSIIIHLQEKMYHLRNNIVHYPEKCIDEVNIIEMLPIYFETFDVPLRSLRDKGMCKNNIINTDRLFDSSNFIFACQRDNQELNDAVFSLEFSKECIINLSLKAEIYYNVAKELDLKYEFTGMLHCAMYNIILQLRKKFNVVQKFDHNLYKKLNALIPDIIKYGNIIAHQFSDNYHHSFNQEGRAYYTEEVIKPFALLDIMKSISNNKNKMQSIIENDRKEVKGKKLSFK
jgi:hypothetical protein